jgi:hypothetical protein
MTWISSDPNVDPHLYPSAIVLVSESGAEVVLGMALNEVGNLVETQFSHFTWDSCYCVAETCHDVCL